MAITIAIANQKGGCGKTTTCMNLAGGLSAAGLRVLVVDADPQGSATEWRNRSEESRLSFDVIAMSTSSIHKELPRVIKNSSYEVAIIDCPPGTETKGFGTVTRSALLAADCVIIPSRPTPIDFLATSIMLPVLADVATIKPEQRVFLLLNAKHSSNRLGRTAKEGAIAMFSDQGIKIDILQTEIHDRTAFAEAPASGQTVVEFAPSSKAAEEILFLTKEVIKLCLVAQQ
ncbi:ParA family partition ATPase [Granulicella arctica]|uniref:ParA family partition ATPase n=1 Tax=Granulicella arctica TaxID=940613 RepID=UPI0021E09035|nr:ParA family partition ATPase [Granulicella arctica]